MNFYLMNFGCKANRYDAVAMTAPLVSGGYTEVRDPACADIIIVNTCTVTARSDAKARTGIRALHRRNPRASIIVTGCSVETQGKALSRLEGVDLVLGVRERFNLHVLLPGPGDRLNPTAACSVPGVTGFDAWRDGIEEFPGRARAFLKIQDGCDNACAYCIVPRVRGKSRSRQPEHIVREASRLLSHGHTEIVLTGIHIGHYGKDIGLGMDLTCLLKRLLEETGVPLLRLGSLNPDEIGDGLLGLVASEERIAKHLHIPLQSGSDFVLARMGRPYRARAFEERVLRAVELMPLVNIGSDVIVGFPAEGGVEYEETWRLIEELPVAYLHVFRYSERPGTRACFMEKRASTPEIVSRAREMKLLGKKKREEFQRRMLGREVMAVLEAKRDGIYLYRSTNYLKVLCDVSSRGVPVFLRITGVRGDVLEGVLVEEPSLKGMPA
jgi:threonylcarbamoyladenosine tRNA methylthiotransferase MtaB